MLFKNKQQKNTSHYYSLLWGTWLQFGSVHCLESSLPLSLRCLVLTSQCFEMRNPQALPSLNDLTRLHCPGLGMRRVSNIPVSFLSLAHFIIYGFSQY